MKHPVVEKSLAAGLAIAVLVCVAWGLTAAHGTYNRNLEIATLRLENAAQRTRNPQSDDDMLVLNWGPGAPIYVTGQNASLAGAELHSLIRRTFERHSGQLEQVENLPPRTDGPLERIALSFAGITDIAGLAGIVGDLEAGGPLIFIEELSVRQHPPDRHDADLIGRLDVTAVLHAYRYRISE